MPTPIFFSSCLGDSKALKEHEDVIVQILEGRLTRGLHFEKLYGANIYSVRTNQKGRLLFTQQKLNGQDVLIFLKALPNHCYPTASDLKRLDKFAGLDLTGLDEIKFVEDEAQFIKCSLNKPGEASNGNQATSNHHWKDLDVYDKAFIELTSEQDGCIKHTLPVGIQGSAGSGKTCVAVKLLRSLQQEQRNRVIYVSPIPELALSVKRIFEDTMDESKHIKFMSMNELISKFYSNFKEVNFEAFSDWINSAWQKNKKNWPESFKKKFSAQDRDLIYQEFQVISGYKEKADYLTLGHKQSLYKSTVREFLWSAYQSYQKYLNTEKQFDQWLSSPNISKLEGKKMTIIVDEAQNFSLGALAFLHELSNQQICFLMDPNQRPGSIPRHDYIKTQLKVDIVHLSKNFRCPPEIMDFANSVLGLSDVVFKKRKLEADKGIAASTETGFVHWVKNHTNVTPRLQQLAQTPSLAVIAPEFLVDEARTKYGTELVFTPEQVAGLQYPYICLYKPFETVVFNSINKSLGKNSIEPPPETVTEKAIKMLYVSCTRATKGLWIDSKNDHQNKNVHIALHPHDLVQNLDEPVVEQSSTTLSEDWLKQAKYLIEQGKEAIAFEVYKAHINNSGDGFGKLRAQVQTQSIEETNNTEPPHPKSIIAASPVAPTRKTSVKKPQVEKNGLFVCPSPPHQSKTRKKANKHLIALEKNFTTHNLDVFLSLRLANDILTEKIPDGSKLFIESILANAKSKNLFIECVLNKILKEKRAFFTGEFLCKNISSNRTVLSYLLYELDFDFKKIKLLRLHSETTLSSLIDAMSQDKLNCMCDCVEGMEMLLHMADTLSNKNFKESHLQKLIVSMQANQSAHYKSKAKIISKIGKKLSLSTIEGALTAYISKRLPGNDQVPSLLDLKYIIKHDKELLGWVLHLTVPTNKILQFQNVANGGIKLNKDEISFFIRTLFLSVNTVQLENKNSPVRVKQVLEDLINDCGAKQFAELMCNIHFKAGNEDYSLLFLALNLNLPGDLTGLIFEKISHHLNIERLSQLNFIQTSNGEMLTNRTLFDEMAENYQKDLLNLLIKDEQTTSPFNTFYRLLGQDEKIISSFKVDLLRNESKLGQSQMPTALLYLSKTDIGHKILNILFKNQKVIDSLTPNDVLGYCRRMGPYIGLSPFSLMCKSSDGTLLAKIFKNKKILNAVDFKKHLVKVYLHRVYKGEIPVIMALSGTEKKLALLLEIATVKNGFSQEYTSKDSDNKSQIFMKKSGKKFFDNLCDSPKYGHPLLKQFFMYNKDLFFDLLIAAKIEPEQLTTKFQGSAEGQYISSKLNEKMKIFKQKELLILEKFSTFFQSSMTQARGEQSTSSQLNQHVCKPGSN